MNRGVSSSSFTPIRWSYDVFLSFRGDDTRNNFTGHLYTALCQKGLHTFIDDHDLRKGDEIGPTLVKAIQESRVFVIVFSKHYASSKWCLDELLTILDCSKESKGQLVWPIFYKVDPSDVRKQRGSFAEAMLQHELQFNINMDRVQRWRTALIHAANLSGWHFPDGHESKFIQNIVEKISIQVSNRTYLNVAKHTVGLESRVRDMHELLSVEDNDVRMVGIWGIGGIGKTTVAKAVYGSIAHRFEGSCFLANVRERSSVPHEGLVQLQEILLSKILGGVKVKLNNADDLAVEIERRLWNKRVLIVLDDVDHLKQLENLAGKPSWFGRGSRVIITTRDKHLLLSHGVNSTYNVKKLDFHEAFELFSWNSFKSDKPEVDYLQLVERAVHYTNGLPLALTVLGSHLFGRSIDVWQDALDKCERIPNKEVQDILKISFNGLEDHQKEVFLDIACFFKGQDKNFTVDILRSCDLYPIYSIAVLIDKSLLAIGDDSNALCMHDLIEDMGKEIVRQESPTVGERSRLWFHEDVLQVLTEETGTNKVRGIMIEMPKKDEIHVAPEALLRMRNLRYLINRNASLVGNIGYLPNSLRFLDWYKYPLESLPSDFNPKKLVALKMPASNISRFGQSITQLDWLKSMDFSRCERLKEIPDFSGFPNLEKLFLRECKSLVGIHDSVGFLDKLVSMNVQDCCNLTRFPTKLGLKSLKVLNMKGCKLLESFPEIEAGTMEQLHEINLECCENLKTLPSSIYKLKHLKQLVVRGSPKLLTFPMSTTTSTMKQYLSNDNDDEEYSTTVFPDLTFLRVGDCNISQCDFLKSFRCLSTLTFLDLSGSSFHTLPTWIIKFVNLQWLILRDCDMLEEIPQLSQSIKGITAGGCKLLEKIYIFSDILDHQNALGWLQWSDLSECHKLLDNMDLNVEKMASILLNQHDDQGKDSYFEFSVVLPGSNIPQWFNFCKHPTDPEYCEFVIKFPPNFNGKNSRLALSAVFESTEGTLTYDYDDYDKHAFHLRVYINGDEIFFVHEHFLICPGSNHVWLQYVSLSDMRHWGRQWNEEQILSKCVVRFLPSKPLSLKTCGVQLVCHQSENDNNDQNSADLQFYKSNYDDLDHEIVQVQRSRFNWYSQQRLGHGALGITLVGSNQEEDDELIASSSAFRRSDGGTLEDVMQFLSAAGITNPHAQRMAFDLHHCAPDNYVLDHDDPVTSLRAALENLTRGNMLVYAATERMVACSEEQERKTREQLEDSKKMVEELEKKLAEAKAALIDMETLRLRVAEAETSMTKLKEVVTSQDEQLESQDEKVSLLLEQNQKLNAQVTAMGLKHQDDLAAAEEAAVIAYQKSPHFKEEMDNAYHRGASIFSREGKAVGSVHDRPAMETHSATKEQRKKDKASQAKANHQQELKKKRKSEQEIRDVTSAGSSHTATSVSVLSPPLNTKKTTSVVTAHPMSRSSRAALSPTVSTVVTRTMVPRKPVSRSPSSTVQSFP
ncbi:TMV resistance protein N-like isoform X2 [Argentina anserina]|uniref:TMV resistance protein N-like isoform X2 n=1 Tax=Argentina anserina TaxID=57926 RepID=UPI0021767ED3|nr:TMV resistance protein N-like isoform X2 [Potentilla anserina]